MADINKQIDKCGMAYKVKDRKGNVFVFSHIENGIAVYRGDRGLSHIFDMAGLEVLEQYL